ncbi:MAG TPA: SDR family oxidoreductase [Steroidobacteraceae bacterium]|nr:SDR family oxidoreductase [Steroidobacteraceae bacterium]
MDQARLAVSGDWFHSEGFHPEGDGVNKVAIVTGTSTGIGLSTAIHLAKAGYQVVATMRDISKAQLLKDKAAEAGVIVEVAQLDVQSDASVKECVDATLANYGRIDVLVNNAGAGFLASTEQMSMEALQKTIDVNFFGVWRCTQAVLPIMRKAKSGHIITLSSIGGLIGQPFNDAYCAAKFAVEGMMESLAPVAKQFGVHVSLVEPGPVNTEFVATVRKGNAATALPADDYAPLMRNYMKGSEQVFATMGQTGDDIAAVIVTAATDAQPHLRYLTSDAMRGLAGRKYVDTTGDSIVAMMGARLAQ